ncbi:DUF2292 domain-containing protein [Sporohalobacter salinus]|nr:DUF2292 domain-containing protein [Sporohalobacter salinus]MBM7623732.1 hypothetical protein [Sporohalobacter salinus]
MAKITEKVVEEIMEEAKDIKHGEVKLVIKDGKVLDIVTEKRKRIS